MVAVFFAAFGLAFDARGLGAVCSLVTREAGRFATRGERLPVVSLLAAGASAWAGLLVGAGRDVVLRLTGCQVCGDRIALCLRNSRAASSWVRRPRCVYVPGFTLFCLLICGT